MKTFRVLHLFGGGGGGALGFQRCQLSHRGQPVGRWETVGSIDAWPVACEVFTRLTGAPAWSWDLCYPEDYEALHGVVAPAGWRPAAPADLRAISEEPPDCVFLSPPCKSFSSLLGRSKAATPKYRAMARLALRGVELICEAWEGQVPLVLLENVPGIRTRGAELLAEMKECLARWGYELTDRDHDAGKIGNLCASRRRFLLAARNPARCPVIVHNPREYPLRGVGEALSSLPVPWKPHDVPFHALPRCKWHTWIRLALIRPGGDWRSLADIEGYEVRRVGKRLLVGAVIGGRSLAPDGWEKGATVGRWGAVDPAWMAGTRFDSGFRMRRWDEPAGTVSTTNASASGQAFVADPRLTCSPRNGAYGVLRYDTPAPAVVASADIHAGCAAVADPRGVPLVVSPWGFYHRPLTTAELAILQGFTVEDLRVGFVGLSDVDARQIIGNAVPVGAGKAIGEEFGLTLAEAGGVVPVRFQYRSNRWVAPSARAREVGPGLRKS